MRLKKSVGAALFVIAAVSTVLAANLPVPAVTSITGYSEGFVSNGRFKGQIIWPGGTNRYKNFLAADSYPNGSLAANPYYWDINGSNFGSVAGRLDFGVSPNPFTSVTIVSWTATKIRVKVVASYPFLSTPIALKVISSTGQTSAAFNDNVCGTIKSRGAGNCTWYAASMRLQQGRSIPPTPWGTNGSISGVGTTDNGYRPALWDCVIYAGHIAIITTAPVQTNHADGSVKWTFTVSEYNAKFKESLSTSIQTFGLSSQDSRGRRTVRTGIASNHNPQLAAHGYYR